LQEQGIATLSKAIAAATEEIERHKGKLVIKDAPRTVSAHFNPSRLEKERNTVGLFLFVKQHLWSLQ